MFNKSHTHTHRVCQHTVSSSVFNKFGPEMDPENHQVLIQAEADRREQREKLQHILWQDHSSHDTHQHIDPNLIYKIVRHSGWVQRTRLHGVKQFTGFFQTVSGHQLQQREDAEQEEQSCREEKHVCSVNSSFTSLQALQQKRSQRTNKHIFSLNTWWFGFMTSGFIFSPNINYISAPTASVK